MKAKSKKSREIRSSFVTKNVVRVSKSNNAWVIGVLVVLAVIVGWQLSKPSIQPQDLSINKVETGVVRERELAKWTFDTDKDFGVSGAWKLPVAYGGPGRLGVNEGKIAVPLLAGIQIVAPTIPAMDLTSDLTGVGKYVVAVRADVVEKILTLGTVRTTAMESTLPTSATEFTMKLVLMDLVKNNKGVLEERVLGTEKIVTKTNEGMRDYEFVVSKPTAAKVTRIRLYLYENVVKPTPVADKTARPTHVKTTTIMNIDEVRVVERLDAREERPRQTPSRPNTVK